MAQSKPVFTPQVILMLLLFVVGIPMLPLIVSGEWRWTEAWWYAILSVLAFAVSRLLVARRFPDLIAERARFASHEDAKPWDKRLAPLLTLTTALTLAAIGLDARLNGITPYAGSVVGLALAIILAGWALGTWALLENRFFSGVVRIQTDRGQKVVRSGPYHWLRHPGYAGALLTTLATPFFLSSLWGLPFALAFAAVLIARTRLEDSTLQAELDGYAAYAGAVRFRLVPGVW